MAPERTRRADARERDGDGDGDGDVVTFELTDAARTLAYVARHVERSLDELTLPQFRVLSFLARAPERASQIASRAGVTKPALTGLIDGLVARGWARRADVDGDRRGVGLAITPAGRRALARASTEAADHLAEVLSHVDEDEREVALEGLAVLSRALGEHRRASIDANGSDRGRS